jgi:hypothetical protein
MSRARRKRDPAAAARTATHPSLLLSAIGQCLKAQYDTLAAPVPPRLDALLKQLEKQERRYAARHADP